MREDLAAIGEFLYGERWQSELARTLNVSDRTVRHWAAGKFKVPLGVMVELQEVLEQRQGDGKTMIGRVRKLIKQYEKGE